MKKLTQAQEFALRQLTQRRAKGRNWSTAFDLNVQVQTLQGLERRGLVENRIKEGRRFAADKDYYEWRLK